MGYIASLPITLFMRYLNIRFEVDASFFQIGKNEEEKQQTFGLDLATEFNCVSMVSQSYTYNVRNRNIRDFYGISKLQTMVSVPCSQILQNTAGDNLEAGIPLEKGQFYKR